MFFPHVSFLAQVDLPTLPAIQQQLLAAASRLKTTFASKSPLGTLAPMPQQQLERSVAFTYSIFLQS
jgi:hypothetical protein